MSLWPHREHCRKEEAQEVTDLEPGELTRPVRDGLLRVQSTEAWCIPMPYVCLAAQPEHA